jgi:hypothetical protein
MIRVESEVEFHWKEDYLMSSDQIVTIEMKLIKLPKINKKEFPEDYKFSWSAFNRDNPEERVRFDNHDRKNPHYHLDNQEEFFTWISLDNSLELFYQKVIIKFGNFEKLIYKHY